MIKVNIGRLGDQPVKIQDPLVSGQHAVLIINSEKDIDLVDIGSTNGTFIYKDGQYMRLHPNKKYKVTPDTFVRLGTQTQMHVRRLMPEEKKIDISHLRTIHENYNDTRLELQTNLQSTQGLRSAQMLIMVLVSLLGGVAGLLNPNSNSAIAKVLPLALGFVVAVVLVVCLNLYIKKKTRAIMNSQQQNEKFYGVNYVCPECHYPFKGQLYENVLAGGKCPKCNTKYFDATAAAMYGGMPGQQMPFPQGNPQPGYAMQNTAPHHYN